MSSESTQKQKNEIIAEFRRDPQDTGSPEVQVALLTDRIVRVTGHLKTHEKDFASRRGLLAMVNKRAKLLKYLDRNDHERYKAIVAKLGLRR